MSTTLTNGHPSTPSPIQLSIPLPYSPASKIHLHLTVLAHALLLFLTSSTPSASSAASAPLGSLVYALPNLSSPSSAPPLSTPLYTHAASLEFATRAARMLARKTRRPVYVGCSISFADAGRGGDVQEEVEALKRVGEVVMAVLEEKDGGAGPQGGVNGV